MTSVKAFLAHTHCKTHFWKCMMLALLTSLGYSVLYQVVMPVVYQIENGYVFYGVMLLLILFVSGICMIFVQYLANIKQEVMIIQVKGKLVPTLVVMLLLSVVLVGLGIASLKFALGGEVGVGSYLVNALLLLGCMLYVPVVLFAFLEIRTGSKGPVSILLHAVKKLKTHYQSVFYSTLLLALCVFGYRYMMSSLFSVSMGVALYDLPLELLTRWVPFLDVPTLCMAIGDNQALWGQLLFSVVLQVLLCAVYILYVFYVICIHDEDVSV